MLFWHWLIIGAVLAGLELVTPGIFLMWLGIAAFLTAVIQAALPDLSWKWSLLMFGGLGIVSVVIGFRFRSLRNPTSDQPNLNKRGVQYIGRQVTLEQAIVDGRGVVKLGDTIWRVSGPDLPAGTPVTVTGVDGAILLVKPRAAAEPG